MKEHSKIFSFDAETDGLWGLAFCIGAIVLDENGFQTARFIARLPNSFVKDQWVIENVLPALEDVSVTHQSYESMIEAFSAFYMQNKKDAEVITHMGYIVETKILRDMYVMGYIGQSDAPYPLYDVADMLKIKGYDPTSVDKYVKEQNPSIPSDFGRVHNPLYDSTVTAAVYRDLMSKRPSN